MSKFHVTNLFFFSLNKIKQFFIQYHYMYIASYISVCIVHFINFKYISSQNKSITTKSKRINM